MKQYVIMKYLRLSSEDIDLDGLDKHESNSIQNQRDYLDGFIAKMPEYADCTVLEALDDGRTGTNFRRPGVQKVLNLASRGEIHCIVVKDLSRFGRNYIEVGDCLEQLFPAWGVRFISVNDQYDSADRNGGTGGIHIAFRNLIAELYSRDLSEKIRSAKDTLSRSGKLVSPYGFYGYIVDPADRHKLIIDAPAANVVRMIFNLYERGLSTVQISRQLNGDGVQTASAHKQAQGAKKKWQGSGTVSMWGKDAIKRILRDERYTGKHIYGKTRRVALGQSSLTRVPKSEWIVVPDAFPPIITAPQFMRVQAMMPANPSAGADGTKKAPSGYTGKQLTKRADSAALFHRKILCGVCGHALARTRTVKGFVYRCNTPNIKSGLDCMRESIDEKTVAKAVLCVVRQRTRFSGHRKPTQKTDAQPALSETSGLRDAIQSLKKRIAQTNAAKLRIFENHQTGALSKAAFRNQAGALTAQSDLYAAKIRAYEANLATQAGQKPIVAAPFSRAVIDKYIQAVYIYAPNRIRIVLKAHCL